MLRSGSDTWVKPPQIVDVIMPSKGVYAKQVCAVAIAEGHSLEPRIKYVLPAVRAAWPQIAERMSFRQMLVAPIFLEILSPSVMMEDVFVIRPLGHAVLWVFKAYAEFPPFILRLNIGSEKVQRLAFT
jgi:hypothetical protein